ncbi:MAG: glycoside hydrolase family 3 protein [Pyrinomonadaceae bacterium]|nr:glycoside hydrolase family 3 protein [Pyrinomonadaceae bacterium]
MKYFVSILLTIAIFCTIVPASPRLPISASNKFEPSEKAWKEADKMLKKMTLEEKIGQLVHIGFNAKYASQDSEFFKNIQRDVAQNKVGGIIVFAGGLYETVHLVNRMQENAKIPLLISADFESGVGMRFEETTNFPWNMAVAATGNPDFARREGEIVGREAKALGVYQVFAPVVDVNNNADNPVINFRSYGENPNDVARFGVAMMQGIQSNRVIATAKHFPGHGDTAIDSHRGLPIIDVNRQRLDSLELIPFKAVIDSGIASVMIAHIALPQIDPTEIKPLKQSVNQETDSPLATDKATVPSTLSPLINTNILHKELGFKGLTVTDAMGMSGLTLYFNQDEAAVRAVLAGSDILEKPADTDLALKGLRDAVNSGRISQERLNESVRKQLAWKYELGLFKNKTTPLESIDKIVSNQQTQQLTDEIAKNAITLVKKQDGVLPLKRGQKAVVLVLTNGEDRLIAGNTLTNSLRAAGLNTERIVFDDRSSNEEANIALSKIKKADVVILGLFARVRSGAKNSIGLPEAGFKVMKEVMIGDKPVVSIAFGNPYFLRNFPEMKTYIAAYGDMTSLQKATANALMGNADFVGKLPITIGDYKIGTGLSLK